jgi:hypothetical protein
MSVPARRDDTDLLGVVKLLGESGAVTPTALTLTDPSPDFDRIEALARMLGRLHDASKWWVADLLLYAEATFGEQASQVADATGRSPETLRRWLCVAERVPPVRRRTKLSFTHHELVAGCEAAEQREWLDRAEANGWSSRDLHGMLHPEELPARSSIAELVRELVAAAVPIDEHMAAVPRRLLDRIGEELA